MSLIPESWSRVLSSPSRKDTYKREVENLDAAIGSFLSFNPSLSTINPDNSAALHGLPVAVKDNIAVEGWPLTCASRMLENFVSPYTATAVDKLAAQGAVVVGKTNLDEFGMGSSNENSALGVTVNPWNNNYVPGGSSGGSAAAVAAGFVPLALGSDTGGSIRQPANFCGVYGLKPTYGSVSRYGLTAYASSLEVIGALSRDIDLLEKSFHIMSGEDQRDQSSLASDDPGEYGRKVAMLDVGKDDLDSAVLSSYEAMAETLRTAGYVVEKIILPSLEFVVPAYYTIATAEASANLARYNGIRYGHAPDYAENPADLMKKSRHEGFGEEVKLRILLGTYVLRSGFQDQYYGKAQKVRTLIRNNLAGVFKNYDQLLMPVFPTQAFPRGEKGMDEYRQRIADVYTCLANLAGLPALSVPTELSGGLPTGVQFMAPAFGEKRLFDVARDVSADYPVLTAPGALDIGSLK